MSVLALVFLFRNSFDMVFSSCLGLVLLDLVAAACRE